MTLFLSRGCSVLLLLALPFLAQAQPGGVGVGTSAPDASAALDIVSSTKGALLPRVSLASAIASPARGLLVFQTTAPAGFYYNAGTPAAPSWQRLNTVGGAGDNLGNHTATQALTLQGHALTGTGASISGIGVGVRADGGLNLGQNTLGNNIYLGYQAGPATVTNASLYEGVSNQFIGYQSGFRNTTGSYNLFSGYWSGYSNTTGSVNHFDGHFSGFSNTTGSRNVFTGLSSGYYNTTGTDNIFSGYESGFRNTTGSANLFSGYRSGGRNSTGNNNLFLGYQSGFNNTSGSNNTALGYESGYYSASGNNITALGANSGPANGSPVLENATALGANVSLTQSNTVILGNDANVGIGTSTPQARLDVQGSVRLRWIGTGLVQSDANGNLSTISSNGSFIQNSTAQQANSNFNVSGNGTVGGLLAVTTALTGNGASLPTGVVGVGIRPDGGLNLGQNTTGSTISIGYQAGSVNTGVENQFIGIYSGNTNTTGARNLFTGNQSGALNTTGSRNHFSGYQSGFSNTTGADNVFSGYFSGYYNTTGSNNTILGANSGPNSNSGAITNATALGAYVTLAQSNTVILGNGASVGIGTSTPNSRLSISPNAVEAKLTLYDGGSTSDHYGFGISGGQLNYHVEGTGARHVFLAGGKNGNGTELMRIQGNGNVGIGTSTPTARLDVVGNALVRGSMTVQTTMTVQNHLMAQSDVTVQGRTFLLGPVGIGTLGPISMLHVNGAYNATPTGTKTFFFPGAGGLSTDGSQLTRPVVAYFTGGQFFVNDAIVAGGLNVSSDQRIKHVIGLSDRAADLALLRQVPITNYTYIDQLSNTDQVVKKVIAQDIQRLMPVAVNKSSQAIPNVFQKATRVAFANGTLTVTTAKPHELPATGGRMRFYTPTNQDLNVPVTVVDPHTVRFASTEAHASGLFVYGKVVDDFLSVDYDAIAMLNVSATQELARKVELLEKQNAALQVKAAQADADHAALQQVQRQATADHAALLTLQAQMTRLLGEGAQAQK